MSTSACFDPYAGGASIYHFKSVARPFEFFQIFHTPKFVAETLFFLPLDQRPIKFVGDGLGNAFVREFHPSFLIFEMFFLLSISIFVLFGGQVDPFDAVFLKVFADLGYIHFFWELGKKDYASFLQFFVIFSLINNNGLLLRFAEGLISSPTYS